MQEDVIQMREMAFEVLELLEDAGKAMSEQEMAERLSFDAEQVKASINELERLGYSFSVSEDGLVTLGKRSERILPYELDKKLRTRFVGKDVRYSDSIPSTLAAAKRLAMDSDPEKLHGTVVVSEQQTGGVGRLGRSWASPPGGIWATIIIRTQLPVERLFMVTMAGSLAIARAIRREYDQLALIKWPNDIFIGPKKVAGLLQEVSTDGEKVNHVLLGLGINANVDLSELPDEVRSIATSLHEQVGEPVDRSKFLARVLKEFELRLLQLESGEYETIVREWKSLSLTLNRRVHVKTMTKSYKGEAIDIDNHGALVIRKDNGKVEKVIAGDLFQL